MRFKKIAGQVRGIYGTFSELRKKLKDVLNMYPVRVGITMKLTDHV